MTRYFFHLHKVQDTITWQTSSKVKNRLEMDGEGEGKE